MLKELLVSFLDIIYPKNCLVCKRALKEKACFYPVCERCWQKSHMNLPPFCQTCGRHLQEKHIHGQTCAECQKKHFHFKRAWSISCFDGIMKDLIHLFKYRNKTSLRILFGKLSADFVTTYNIPMQNFDMIVPVPLHSTRLREREYNQTDVLAKELAHYFPIQVCPQAVKRIRNTKPQATLKARQRLNNLQDAFAVTDADIVKDKNILVLDDLFTTGATVSEMARVLTSSGAHEVSVLTLAIAQ